MAWKLLFVCHAKSQGSFILGYGSMRWNIFITIYIILNAISSPFLSLSHSSRINESNVFVYSGDEMSNKFYENKTMHTNSNSNRNFGIKLKEHLFQFILSFIQICQQRWFFFILRGFLYSVFNLTMNWLCELIRAKCKWSDSGECVNRSRTFDVSVHRTSNYSQMK